MVTPFPKFGYVPSGSPRPKQLLSMSVLTLDKKYPLTKAGLRFVRVVERAELCFRLGDVVFEFPYVVLLTMVWRADGSE